MIGASRAHFVNFRQGILNYNRGSTPRQLYLVNAKRTSQLGIRRNAAFNPTGDDIGFVTQIMLKGKDLGTVSNVFYNFVDDKKNSTIRNKNNCLLLHKQEEALLESFGGLGCFRKTKPKQPGDPVFFDINFQKYVEKYHRKSFIEY